MLRPLHFRIYSNPVAKLFKVLFLFKTFNQINSYFSSCFKTKMSRKFHFFHVPFSPGLHWDTEKDFYCAYSKMWSQNRCSHLLVCLLFFFLRPQSRSKSETIRDTDLVSKQCWILNFHFQIFTFSVRYPTKQRHKECLPYQRHSTVFIHSVQHEWVSK